MRKVFKSFLHNQLKNNEKCYIIVIYGLINFIKRTKRISVVRFQMFCVKLL